MIAASGESAGQRIRRTITQIQNIEDSLAHIVEQSNGAPSAEPDAVPLDDIRRTGHDLAQAEIDCVLGK